MHGTFLFAHSVGLRLRKEREREISHTRNCHERILSGHVCNCGVFSFFVCLIVSFLYGLKIHIVPYITVSFLLQYLIIYFVVIILSVYSVGFLSGHECMCQYYELLSLIGSRLVYRLNGLFSKHADSRGVCSAEYAS